MKVMVVGGTGVIGREVVARLSGRHEVVTACRQTGDVEVDIESEESIRRLFERGGAIDAVVCTAGEAVFKPLPAMTPADFAVGLRYKLMGQINLVRLATAAVGDGGSITLTSGRTAREPMPGAAAYGTVNAGIEGFVRAAALDMPRGIRINAVSPQWTTQTLELYAMDPALGVPASEVARGYVASVEGDMTGTVIDAGWHWDPLDTSMTVAAPVAVGA